MFGEGAKMRKESESKLSDIQRTLYDMATEHALNEEKEPCLKKKDTVKKSL